MTGKSHVLFGVGTGSAMGLALYLTSPVYAAGFAVATVVGSMFPDIDNPKSLISKPIKIISVILNKMFGHRGLLHAPILYIGIYFLVNHLLSANGISQYLFLLYGFLFGCVGHMFLDMLTAGGVSILYPFSRKRYKMFKIKTGGIAEGIALIFAAVVAAVFVALVAACIYTPF